MGSRLARVAELLGLSKRELSIEQVRSILDINSGVDLPVTHSDMQGLTAVYGAVKLLSGVVADMPIRAVDQRTGQHVPSWIDRPGGAVDPVFTPHELLSYVVGCILLQGNFYAIRRHARLHPIEPSRVKPWPVLDKDGVQVGNLYEVRPPHVRHSTSIPQLWQTVNDRPGDVQIYLPDELLHVPGFGYDGVQGYTPLTVCAKSLGLAANLERTQALWAKNRGMPSGFLKTERSLDPAKADVMQKRWQQKVADPERAGQVAILDGGVVFEQLSLSPIDQQLLESRLFTISEVARIFQIPAFLLASADGYSAGSGLETQNKSLLTYAVEPLLARVEQRFSLKLRDPGVVARFDRSSLTRPDDKTLMQTVAGLRDRQIISINQALTMFGLPADPDPRASDKFYVSPKPDASQPAGNAGLHGGGEDAEQ